MNTVNPGFVDVYGFRWDKVQCDQYNRISAEVADKEAAGMDVSQLLIDRHRIYCMPYISSLGLHVSDSFKKAVIG